MPREHDQVSVQRQKGMVTTIRRVGPSSVSTPSRPATSKSSEGLSATAAEDSNTQLADSASASHSQDPPPSRRGRKGFTVHWPFQTQSIATDTLSVFTTQPPALFRRATWNPPKPPADDLGEASPRDSTLIPDYIVNFIRGETPETVARRMQNGGARGMRAVNITHHKPQRSHMALVEGMDGNELKSGGGGRGDGDGDGDAQSHMTGTSTTTERRQILPGDEKGGRALRSLTSGWRSGVVLNMVLSLVILIAGFVCIVVAGTKLGFRVGDMALFTGSCSTAMSLDWGLHAAINVAVLVLLIGANYAFQVLSSPTRSEIAEAHERKSWLEIGVPSARNLRHIGRGRALLVIALLVVAVAIQIIYNSLIFVSETGFDYNLIAVKSDFLSGSQFSNSSENNSANLTRSELLDLQRLATEDELTALSIPACINVFGASFNDEFQNILLVLDDDSLSSDSLIATARGGLNRSASSDPSTRTTTTSSQILVDGAAVSSCLAQPTTQNSCSVELNGALFIVVLALNLLMLLLTGCTLLRRRFQPLVTLGDAIASFLRDPDPSTRRNALVTKPNLRRNMGAWGFTEGKYWAPTRDTRWFHTASLTQWLSFITFFVISLALIAGALALALASQILDPPTLSPFGRPTPRATFLINGSLPSAAVISLVAALPQLFVAGLYLSTNALLTAFFLSRESARHAILGAAVDWRGLRVSTTPIGAQTTSVFLTLPRPVSWALAGWFVAMGFVLSQACFAVSLIAAGSPSTAAKHIMGVGFSGVALVVLLGMVVVQGLVIIGLAVGLKMPSATMADGRSVGNPLVFEGGSCSAVVSARCHRVPGETDVSWSRPLFGVVPDGETPPAQSALRHLTYSAGPVAELDGTHRYV